MEDEARDLKGRTAKGAVWMMLEQTCTQGLNFTLGIILAHLLTPTDYGIVALVMIFITVGQVLVTSGLGQALVQKKEVDVLDFTMVFYLGLAVAAVLYVVLFFAAPSVAAFYKNDGLVPVLRVLTLNLFLIAIGSVQAAEVCRAMRFDLSFRIALSAVLTSFIVGVVLAAAGFGVWAIVWSCTLSNLVGVIVRGILLKWRLCRGFDLARLKPLYRFGWKMMASSLVSVSLSNLYGVLVGRLYSPADLAFVNKSRNLPDLLRTNLNTVFTQTGLAALSRMQDEIARMREALRRLMAVNVFIVFPSMILLCLIARDLILFLYGEQWTTCIPYLRVLSVGTAFGVLEGVNSLPALARGRSDLVLKASIVRTVLAIAVLVVFLPHGISSWILATAFVYGPLSLLIDVYLADRMVGYTWRMVAADVLPTVVLFGAVACVVHALDFVLVGDAIFDLFVRLVAKAALAFVLFVAGAIVFRLRAMREISLFLSPRLSSRFPIWARLAAYLEGGRANS